MLRFAKKAVPLAALAVIVLFYVNEIWRSSKSPHHPLNYAHSEHATYETKHDNKFGTDEGRSPCRESRHRLSADTIETSSAVAKAVIRKRMAPPIVGQVCQWWHVLSTFRKPCPLFRLMHRSRLVSFRRNTRWSAPLRATKQQDVTRPSSLIRPLAPSKKAIHSLIEQRCA